jgi:hypothetical protein
MLIPLQLTARAKLRTEGGAAQNRCASACKSEAVITNTVSVSMLPRASQASLLYGTLVCNILCGMRLTRGA